MAARKATSRPRTGRARKNRKKTPVARKRASSPARSRRAAAGRKKTTRRPALRRAKATRRPAPVRKAVARRRKKVAGRAKATSARPAPAARKRAATPAGRKSLARTAPPGRKKVTRAAPVPKARATTAPPAPRTPAARAVRSAPPPLRPSTPPGLARERRQLVDADWEPDDAAERRLASSAKTGSDEMRQLLGQHHESSPVLTAGDVDAKWTDAYAVGDEAPGGDNPTPDQDRVDDIGKALGVSYEDNEELRGSDKIIERDRHRWELDPASSDDWPHDKD